MAFISTVLKKKWLIVAVLVVLGGGYYAYRSNQSAVPTTSYVSAKVERGTLTVSVSSTGEVDVTNQVEVKPKGSGDVVSVPVVNGQAVKAGTVLAQLDTSDALKTVRDAQSSLDSAKLALAKLEQSADALSLLQAQNSLDQAKESKQTTLDDLANTYENGFNKVANTFLTLPAVMSGLQDALYGLSLGSGGQSNKYFYVNEVERTDSRVIQYANDASVAYETARSAYDASFTHYKSINRSSGVVTIEALISETYTTTRLVAEAVKSTTNLVQFYVDKLSERSLKPSAGATVYLNSLNSYTGQMSSALSDLLSVQTSIQNDKTSLVGADRSIAEKTESLVKLKAGADPLDVKTQQLSIQQRENTLADARAALSDYTVRAPFGGVVAQVSVKVGDAASSGTAVATLVTTQRLANVSLNEVDVAKVKVGQKVVLSFEAIDGLTEVGQVADIATIGTTSQGVVSYAVKINFAGQDERIRDAMSVSANIITDVRQDVLMVPSSAVKTQGGRTYVQVLVSGVPQQKTVEVGLANDSMIEVVSGVQEGDEVVTQTITSGATSTTNTSTQSTQQRGGTSGIRIPGVGGF